MVVIYIKIRPIRLQVALSGKKCIKKPLVVWPSSRSLYRSQTISKGLMSSYSLIVLYANFEKNTIILVILFSKLAFLDTLREFSVIQLPSSSLGRELSFLCKNFVNHFYKIIPYLSICVFAGKSLDFLEILQKVYHFWNLAPKNAPF